MITGCGRLENKKRIECFYHIKKIYNYKIYKLLQYLFYTIIMYSLSTFYFVILIIILILHNFLDLTHLLNIRYNRQSVFISGVLNQNLHFLYIPVLPDKLIALIKIFIWFSKFYKEFHSRFLTFVHNGASL